MGEYQKLKFAFDCINKYVGSNFSILSHMEHF